MQESPLTVGQCHSEHHSSAWPKRRRVPSNSKFSRMITSTRIYSDVIINTIICRLQATDYEGCLSIFLEALCTEYPIGLVGYSSYQERLSSSRSALQLSRPRKQLVEGFVRSVISSIGKESRYAEIFRVMSRKSRYTEMGLVVFLGHPTNAANATERTLEWLRARTCEMTTFGWRLPALFTGII